MGDGADQYDLTDICDGCGEMFADCECEEWGMEDDVCPECDEWLENCCCDDNAPMPRGTDFHDEEN